MDNPRLKGIVKKFAESKSISQKELWEQYQYFSNYLLLKKFYYDTNNNYPPYESELDNNLLESINFGRDNSMAVDGCFMVYKGTILHTNLDDEEWEEKTSKIKDEFLEIYLIQTKSGKLNPHDLSTLTSCLNTDFKEQPEWAKFIKTKERISKILELNTELKLKFKIVYVEGKPTPREQFNNLTFEIRVKGLKEVMKDFFWIGKEDWIDVIFFSDNQIIEEFELQELNIATISKTVNHVQMTEEIEIPEVGKVLYGVLEFKELMKIIYDKEKNRRYELYGYNVRDVINNEEIKSKIIDTIKNNGDNFILLNNGITMIVSKQDSKEFKRRIILENIKIVNGCQTCNAILETCKDTTEYDNCKVSVKIIETDKDEAFIGNITVSTNNQNSVTTENLLSVHPKMFELERAFKDFDLTNTSPFQSVLFERLEGQHRGKNVKSIDMLALSKAYISAWDRKPNEALMYREEVLNNLINHRDNDTEFIRKSLIAGVLWNNFQITPQFYNARFHVFSILVNDLIKNNLQSINLNNLVIHPNTISEITEAITTAKDENGAEYFPSSTAKGKIHYRKFYPPTTLNIIEYKFNELRNGINTATNTAS